MDEYGGESKGLNVMKGITVAGKVGNFFVMVTPLSKLFMRKQGIRDLD